MKVQNDNFVGVPEEAELLLRHLYCAMMDGCDLLDSLFEFLDRILNLRVGHCYWLKLLGLLLVFVFRPLKSIKSVRDVGPFNLLTVEVFDLLRCLKEVFLAELNEAHVLLEIFLFTINASFLDT